MEANKYGIFFTILSGIASAIATLIYTAATGTAQTVIYVTKEVAKRVGPSLPTIAASTITIGMKLSETLLWISNHIVSFILGCISVSFTLYQVYGEESSFPILAIWTFVLAMGFAFLNYIVSFRKYLPF